jgi:hypothetical protein
MDSAGSGYDPVGGSCEQDNLNEFPNTWRISRLPKRLSASQQVSWCLGFLIGEESREDSGCKYDFHVFVTVVPKLFALCHIFEVILYHTNGNLSWQLLHSTSYSAKCTPNTTYIFQMCSLIFWIAHCSWCSITSETNLLLGI